MSQPEWEFIANLGDVNPLTSGGLFVYRDKTGVYPPEAERVEPLGRGRWETRRGILAPCTFVNGVLSDNPYHPDHPAWFANSLTAIASYSGTTVDALIAKLCSDDPIQLTEAYRAIFEFGGWDNFDAYPCILRHAEAEQRFNNPHQRATHRLDTFG